MESIFTNNMKLLNFASIKDRLVIVENILTWMKPLHEKKFTPINNIHIDELFEGFKEREKWLFGGLYCYEVLLYLDRTISNTEICPLLHIEMNYTSKEPKDSFDINLDSFSSEIHDFTPPSLIYSSKEYFRDFYLKELGEIKFSNIEMQSLTKGLNFYFRTYLDENEGNMYSREVYVFSDFVSN